MATVTEPGNEPSQQPGGSGTPPRRGRRWIAILITASVVIAGLVGFVANSTQILEFFGFDPKDSPYSHWWLPVALTSDNPIQMRGQELSDKYLPGKELRIKWRGGAVFLSGKREGEASFAVDDELTVRFTDGEGNPTSEPLFLDFSDNCTAVDSRHDAIDLSKYLKEGKNILHIKINDHPECSGTDGTNIGRVGSSNIFLEGHFTPDD